MNRTKIGWCDASWNPITGCYHNCPYCYARNIANRFGGFCPTENPPESRKVIETPHGELLDLWESGGQAIWRNNGQCVPAPYPLFFTPTIHRYRLDEPKGLEKPQTIFVCSMADLFGAWVPVQWIRDVFDACLAAPWHRYLFLTKNPFRYFYLNKIALLPHDDNFWYGVTVTDDNARRLYRYDGYHLFWSIEPLLGSVEMWITHSTEEAMIPRLPEWVIIGAETGNRRNKVIPEWKWVEDIRAFCEKFSIPVFYKDSIRKLFPDLPESRFPWKT